MYNFSCPLTVILQEMPEILLELNMILPSRTALLVPLKLAEQFVKLQLCLAAHHLPQVDSGKITRLEAQCTIFAALAIHRRSKIEGSDYYLEKQSSTDDCVSGCWGSRLTQMCLEALSGVYLQMLDTTRELPVMCLTYERSILT